MFVWVIGSHGLGVTLPRTICQPVDKWAEVGHVAAEAAHAVIASLGAVGLDVEMRPHKRGFFYHDQISCRYVLRSGYVPVTSDWSKAWM